jgi:outer membrane protein OmpA-like peptidoglycan-associated protein
LGYADNVGPEDGNIKKSQRRAESVLNYYVSRGIQESRFEVIGMGSKDPIADNSTPEGRAQNRRVEIIRIDK